MISFEYIRTEHISLYFICTSTGGPPTTITWRRNGRTLVIDGTIYQQNQRIINTTTATYENILYSIDSADSVGTFTCIVSNARGSANKSISTSGMHSLSELIGGYLSNYSPIHTLQVLPLIVILTSELATMQQYCVEVSLQLFV